MKKYLSLILLALLPLVANAQDVYVCIDGIYYYIYEDYAEVANHYSYSGAMTIPESIRYNDNTFSVTSIGDFAFWNCNGLTSITIPNSLTSIGKQAFSGCSGLTSINIPESVTSVGGAAFSDCIGLTSVTIECPNVGFWFRGLSSIKNITLGEKVISIGDDAFWNCSGLTDVTIPESVTYIGNGAFHGCGLTSIIIPNNVTNIGEGAFGTCTNLTSVIIGSGVTSISDLVFWNCKSLISITIPESVTNIGWCSFMDCSSLTDVYCLAKNVPETDSDAFVYTPIASTTLHVPAGSVDLYKAASPWNEFGTIVAIKGENSNIEFADANVKAICVSNWDTNGDGELSYAEAAAVTDLGTVFKENQSITTFNELRYFTGLTSIGNSAFVRCKSLTSIDIPVSVTSIGEHAFFFTGLTSVTIPQTVTNIGTGAFAYCSGMTSITIGNSVTSISGYTFDGCSSLTSITIPNSVTSIDYYAFYGCASLTFVSIGNSVESIGDLAFSGCSGLTSVTIPNSVMSIGIWAFDCGNKYGNAIYVGNDDNPYRFLIHGGEGDFINDLCEFICPGAFYGHNNLTSITIPISVISIGREAFYGCI